MKTKIHFLSMLLSLCSMQVEAQNFYVQDNSLYHQYTTVETSVGDLNPELWYKLLHNDYLQHKAHDPARGMNSLRSHAAIRAYQQVEYADSIDNVMVHRAHVEALNIADRSMDMAWQVEGGKIESLLGKFRENIEHVTLYGGTSQQYESWRIILKSYEDSLESTKKAYQPNSKRHEIYLFLYNDIKERNQRLLAFLRKLKANQDLKRMTSHAASVQRPGVKDIANGARDRWREVMLDLSE